MLLPNMSYSELSREFDLDYNDSVWPRIKRIVNNKIYRKVCLGLRSEECHAFKPIEFKSKSNNDIVIYITSYGKSDFKRNGLHSQTLMKIQGNRASNYITRVDSTGGVLHCIFSHHLFERYAQRKLNDINADIKDVMTEVITQLNHVVQKPVNDDRYPNGFFAISTFGVFLGEYISDERFVIYKTYVSFEQLHSSQDKLHDSLQPLLEWMDKEMPNDIL